MRRKPTKNQGSMCHIAFDYSFTIYSLIQNESIFYNVKKIIDVTYCDPFQRINHIKFINNFMLSTL